MSRIYRYILVDDLGMAPCSAGGLITLATCKPVIRRTAQPGDWIVGFRRGSLERGLVLWAGRVTEILPHGEYERAFRGRPDAIYREGSAGAYTRLAPDYHPTQAQMDRDLSGPVLVFDPQVSCYFHGQPIALPLNLAHLAPAGRGHRVSGTQPGDVARLEEWLVELQPIRSLSKELDETSPGLRDGRSCGS